MIKKILYPSRIESNNLGDIIINALLVRELSKYGTVYFKGNPTTELLHLSKVDNSYNGRIKVLDFNTNSFLIYKFSVLKYILLNRNVSYSFETPGHLSSKENFFKSILKIFLDLVRTLIYKFFGIKFVRLGVTLGPYSNFEWYLVRYIIKNSYKNVVRDSSNYKFLKLRNRNVNYLPDLAFLLFNDSLLKLVSNSPFDVESDLLISMRGNLKGKKIDNTYFSYQLQKIKDILKNNLSVKKIIISYQVDADKESSQILYDSLQNLFPNITFVFLQNQLSFYDAIKFYSNSNLLITNRLHVLLISMSLSVPSIIVTDNVNHLKLIDIVNDLQLSELYLDGFSNIDWDKVFLIYSNTALKNKKLVQCFIKDLILS